MFHSEGWLYVKVFEQISSYALSVSFVYNSRDVHILGNNQSDPRLYFSMNRIIQQTWYRLMNH